LAIGEKKGGKTSLANVLPQYLVESTHIPVPLQLDLTASNQSFSIVSQLFTAIFNELIKYDPQGEKNPFYLTWRRQVNSADTDINPEEELIEIGSKIAFHLKFPNSPMTIEPVTINKDLNNLQQYVRNNTNFRNLVVILDNPINLLNLDDSAKSLFSRLFCNENSPLLICTLAEGQISETNMDGENLFSFLKKHLLPTTEYLRIPNMSRENIAELITHTEDNYQNSTVRKLSTSVYQFTNGNPYLTKMLLRIVGSKRNALYSPELNASDFTKLISQSRFLLSKRATEMIDVLNKIRTERNSKIVSALDVIIGASAQKNPAGVVKFDGLKNPREIILTKFLPEEIVELDSKVSEFVNNLRELWRENLFTIIDEDFNEISYEINPNSELITAYSRICVIEDKFLLAYTRVLARDIDPAYKFPSRISYLSGSVSKFSQQILVHALNSNLEPEGKSSIGSKYILGRAPKRDLNNWFEGNADVSIKESIDNLDHENFSSYFRLGLEGSPFARLEAESEGCSYICLTLAFRQIELPELEERPFLIRLASDENLEEIELRLIAWHSSNKSNMESQYGIVLESYAFIPIDTNFVEEVIFLNTRGFRLSKYFDLFEKNAYEELATIIKNHLELEIEFATKFDSSSSLMRNFYSNGAMQMSYMAACTGLFNLAMEGFDYCKANDHNQMLMLQDDRAICYALIGDISQAIIHSHQVFEKVSRSQTITSSGYWKLSYIPFNTSSTVMGSYSTFSEKWSSVAYQIQHAIFLIIKGRSGELTDSDREFLKLTDELLSEAFVKNLAISDSPIHRLLAFYLHSTSRNEEAIDVLTAMLRNEKKFESLQVNCARMDLSEIERSFSNG
jgi:hypothetical protein